MGAHRGVPASGRGDAKAVAELPPGLANRRAPSQGPWTTGSTLKALRLTLLSGVTALALLAAARAHGQTSVDRAHAASTFVGGTAIGSNGARLSPAEQVEVRLPLPPLRLGKEAMLIPTLGYDSRWRGRAARSPNSGEVDASNLDNDRNFHRFQLGLTFMVPLSERWRGLIGVNAKATTDLQERGFDARRDGTLTAFAMGMYKMGGDPRFLLTLGLATTYPFGRVPLFPMVGVAYRKDPYIVELGLPRSALLFKPLQGVEVGVIAAFERETFRTRFDDYVLRPDAVYLRETALRVGPALNVHMGANLWLSSSVGMDLMNDFTLLDANRDSLGVNAATQPAPYVRLLLGWRPERRAAPAPAPTPRLVRPPTHTASAGTSQWL